MGEEYPIITEEDEEQTMPAAWTCENCSASNDLKHSFCPECGAAGPGGNGGPRKPSRFQGLVQTVSRARSKTPARVTRVMKDALSSAKRVAGAATDKVIGTVTGDELRSTSPRVLQLLPAHTQELLATLHKTKAALQKLEKTLKEAQAESVKFADLQQDLILALGAVGKNLESRTVGAYLASEATIIQQKELLEQRQRQLLWDPLTSLLQTEVKQAYECEKELSKAVQDYAAAGEKKKELTKLMAEADAQEQGFDVAAQLKVVNAALKEANDRFAPLEDAIEAHCMRVEEKKLEIMEQNLGDWMQAMQVYHRLSLGTLGVAALYRDPNEQRNLSGLIEPELMSGFPGFSATGSLGQCFRPVAGEEDEELP